MADITWINILGTTKTDRVMKVVVKMFHLRSIVKGFVVITALSFLPFFYITYRDRVLTYRYMPNIHNENFYIAKIKKADVTIKIVANTNMNSLMNATKRIIWYDYYNNDHGLRNKGSMVDFNLCPFYKNCLRLPDFILDKNGNNLNHLQSADAVIVQGIHYDNFKRKIPRRKGQIFVFAERESGWLIGCNDTYGHFKYKDVFNWTMTFRRDSDIPMLYGDIISKYDEDKRLLTAAGREANQDMSTLSFSQIYEEKTHSVIWLVSHCNTYSLREDYVKELQKYIHVDIVGKCGRNVCPKKGAKMCLSSITKKYKFILSFENTFQTDYITEKLYSWISKPIVQVVFGLGDYKQYVPKGTIINAANYESPKHLANYLHTLGSDKSRYIHYLNRKNQYFAVEHTEMQQQAYCKLCEMLNNVDIHRKTYSNIAKWWQSKNTSRVNKFVSKNVLSIPHQCDEMR